MLIRPVLCWSIGEVTSNIAPTFRDTHCGLAYDVCDRLLGTGHYLSPGDGGRRILGGITWLLGEQKGGSVVIENPKVGIAGNFGRIHRGTTQICLGNEDMGGGGDRESHQNYWGDHLTKVTFKEGIGSISPCLAPNPPPPVPPPPGDK